MNLSRLFVAGVMCCLSMSLESTAQVVALTPAEARLRLYTDPGTVFLDVREISEWNQAHLPGALLMPAVRAS